MEKVKAAHNFVSIGYDFPSTKTGLFCEEVAPTLLRTCNARMEIQQKADYVTKSNDDDGIEVALNKFVLKSYAMER